MLGLSKKYHLRERRRLLHQQWPDCGKGQRRQVLDRQTQRRRERPERKGWGGKERLSVRERGLNLQNPVLCYHPFPAFLMAFPPSLVFLCPLQGFIPLQGNQVSELTPHAEEPGKHLFEIAPGRPAFPFPSYLTWSCSQPPFNTVTDQPGPFLF